MPLAAATTLNKHVKPPSLLASAFLSLDDRENAEKFALVALKRDSNNKLSKEILLCINK